VSERLYTDLATWWPVLSPPHEYVEEAAYALALLAYDAGGPPRTLLELGCGGGHMAHWFPPELALTLVDLSQEMIEVSRALNPGREHLQGDMRSLRLDRSFDAVLLHDAVMYLTTEDDLRAALATVAAHLRPGGAALILPDCVAEDWQPGTEAVAHALGDRQASMLEWQHTATGTQFLVDFALLLKDGDGPVQGAHETHVHGLFSRETWWRLLGEVGLRLVAPAIPPPHERYGEILLVTK
jgi:SAM-dependent methyltransferase